VAIVPIHPLNGAPPQLVFDSQPPAKYGPAESVGGAHKMEGSATRLKLVRGSCLRGVGLMGLNLVERLRLRISVFLCLHVLGNSNLQDL